MSEQTTVIFCPVCGREITNLQERQKYCSKRCSRKAKRQREQLKKLTYECPACGTTSTVPTNTLAGVVCMDCVPFDCEFCGKLAYNTFEAADWARRALEVRRSSEKRLRPMRVYFNRECGNWHLTSQLTPSRKDQ